MRVSRGQNITKHKYRYPYEVFAELEAIKSFHERVKHLQQNASFAIKTILQCNFSPHIKLDLPEGSPPYRKDVMPPDQTPARIDKAIKVLGKLACYPGQPAASGLAKIKMETLFVNLLETINENDAEIILAMKEKELEKSYPSIDLTLVKTAFPELV